MARFRHLILLCLAAALGLAVWSCSESEQAILDFDLVEANIDTMGSIILESSNLDTYYQVTRQTHSRVWVGQQASTTWPVRAKALFRFAVSLPEGATIVDDLLELECDLDGDYFDTTPQTIAVEQILAHEPTWFDSTSVDWPFDAHTPLSVVTQFEATICDTNSVAVELPVDVLQAWVDDDEQNFGLALVPVGAGAFKRFLASATELTIGYTVEADTTRQEVTFTRQTHTTIFELDNDIQMNGTGRETFARVAGPHDFRGILAFDLAALPADASINQMDLHLTLDPAAASVTSTVDTVQIGFHRMLSDPEEELDARPAVSFFVTPVAEVEVTPSTSDTVRLVVDISHFSTTVEDGILIRQMQDYPSLVEFGFFTREAPAQYRPRLEVIFTLPPRPRL